jgi:hypothetical protein
VPSRPDASARWVDDVCGEVPSNNGPNLNTHRLTVP